MLKKKKKEQVFSGNHSQTSTRRCLTQRWVGSAAIGELRVGICTPPRLGMGPRMTGAQPGGGRMGSGRSQVSSSCNIDGVMEYCTLPPVNPTPGPSWTRDHKLSCGDITEGTVRTPCPLPSAPLTARPFSWGHKATPTRGRGRNYGVCHTFLGVGCGGGSVVRGDRQKGQSQDQR